jgi:hypothetical protein
VRRCSVHTPERPENLGTGRIAATGVNEPSGLEEEREFLDSRSVSDYPLPPCFFESTISLGFLGLGFAWSAVRCPLAVSWALRLERRPVPGGF